MLEAAGGQHLGPNRLQEEAGFYFRDYEQVLDRYGSGRCVVQPKLYSKHSRREVKKSMAEQGDQNVASWRTDEKARGSASECGSRA